jgi:1,2-diacylglycerol 3-alpha-glucosyltransferase
MKILFASDTYFPHINGVYYFVCRVAPILQDMGHEVAVIAPSATSGYTETRVDNIRVYGIPSFPVFYYPKLRVPSPVLITSRLRRILLEFGPDVVHVQDHFLIGKKVITLCHDNNIPVIGTNHFMPENLTALFKNSKVRKAVTKYLWAAFINAYNQLELVTTPTETAAELIRSKLTAKVIAVSSGVDLREFYPGRASDQIRVKYRIPEKPILLFTGRLDPEKKIGEILEAMAIARKETDFSFLIVGRGMEGPALEKMARELGIQDDVIFTGFVPDEDLPELYRLSNCFIIASTAELLSLGTLQAMATGLPVVAVKAGALPELVENGVNGYLFESGNLLAMVEGIRTILANDDLACSMGRKSLELAGKHSINETIDRLMTIYHAKAGGKPVSFSKQRAEARK